MPLYLDDKAVRFGDLLLANNDVVLEVQTPASMLETKVYPDKHAMELAGREFSRRTETDWNAFIYFLPKDRRNDRAYLEAAKADHHIHMIATHFFAGGLRIDRLLPKSAHRKNEYRVDLADAPLAEWDRLVVDMSGQTRTAVERFRIHYVERFLDRSRER